MSKALTAKEQRFADLYDGNGTETCRKAGYKGSDNTLAQQARKNLRKPQIKKAIREREKKETRPLIADRMARQEFWTRVMNNKATKMLARLKASELLGKSEADFTEKVKHSGSVSVRVVDPYALPPDETK